MKPRLRFALVAALIAGSYAITAGPALAQNTDEAHARCAQGGGQKLFSGAGEPNERGVYLSPTVRGFDTIPHAPNNDSGHGDSGGATGEGGGVGHQAIARALGGGGRDSVAGAGGGGGEGGLGGSLEGGGAGGCSESLAPPRRLPATGGGPSSVGIMGGSFVAFGGVLLVATRYFGRRFEPFSLR